MTFVYEEEMKCVCGGEARDLTYRTIIFVKYYTELESFGVTDISF